MDIQELLIKTDAPCLGGNGRRTGCPSMVREIAVKLSSMFNMTLQYVGGVTTSNALLQATFDFFSNLDLFCQKNIYNDEVEYIWNKFKLKKIILLMIICSKDCKYNVYYIHL